MVKRLEIMKLLVTPQYYADNRAELKAFVKDTSDIIVVNKSTITAPCLVSDDIVVLNKQLKERLKELYYNNDLNQNLNNEQ